MRRATPLELSFLLGASLLLTLFVLHYPTTIERTSLTDTDFVPKPLALSDGNAAKSKLVGRHEYEWLRLRDPATGRIPRGIVSRSQAFASTLPVAGRSRGKYARAAATQNWTERGPVNVGGRTRALAIDVSNPLRVFAGGVTGGLWLSEDSSQSWTRVTSLAEQPAVSCIDQDERAGHTDTWYYGTGEYTGSGSRDINSRRPRYTGDGIYKSVDGGLSWDQLPSTASTIETFTSTFDVVFRVRSNPANADQDEVWAACLGTIQRSLDGGTSWQTLLGSFDPDVHPAWTDVAITPTGVVYATIARPSTDHGFWRYDNGVWEQLAPPSYPENNSRTVIGIAPSNETHVYFLSHAPGYGNYGHGLWHLHRNPWIGMDVWQNLSANLPNFTGQGGLNFGATMNSQGGYNMLVAAHPDTFSTVYVGGTSLFRATDGFNSTDNTDWIGGYNFYYGSFPVEDPYNISYPYHHADCHNLAFEPGNPDVLYSSHDGGLSKSYESLATPTTDRPFPWRYIEGYITTQFYWVAVNPTSSQDDIIIGGMQDNGTKSSTGSTLDVPWTDVFGGDGMACAIGEGLTPGGLALYASSQYGGSFFRVDLASDYSVVDWAYLNPPGSFDRWITPYFVSPADHTVLYMADRNSILVSDDRGNDNSWSVVPNSTVSGWWVTALGVSETPADVVYYGAVTPDEGAEDSRVFRIEDAQSSTPTITEVSSPDFSAGWIHCIAVDPLDADVAIVVFTNFGIPSLFLTEDGGLSWRDIGGNLEENPDGSGDGPGTFWAEITHRDGLRFVLVGSTVGLYSTSNLSDPVNWQREGESSLGTVWVTHIDARRSDGFVALGTHGYGTFSGYLDLTGVEAEPSLATPGDFALAAPWPNPFNGATNLSLELPTEGEVSVELFNTLGQRVKTVHSGPLAAGSHRIHLRPGDLASGVYLLRARHQDGQQAVRKLVYTP